MAAKNNYNGKELRKEPEGLNTEIEEQVSNVNLNKDEPGLQSSDSSNTQTTNENLDGEKNESKCNAIEEANNEKSGVSSSLGIEKDAEKESNDQSHESELKTVASYFDDFLSDVDVEYL